MAHARQKRTFRHRLLRCLLASNVRSFGWNIIIALASTSKLYAEGLYDELRRAKRLTRAVVAWPARGAVVVLTNNFDVNAGLDDGTSFQVIRVLGDHLHLVEAQALAPARVQRVVLPRRCLLHAWSFLHADGRPFRMQGLTGHTGRACGYGFPSSIDSISASQLRGLPHGHAYVLFSRV